MDCINVNILVLIMYLILKNASIERNWRNDTQDLFVLFLTTTLNPDVIKTKIFFFKYTISQLITAFKLTISLSSFLLFFIQAWNFISRLPVIDVGLSVKGWWDDSVEGHSELSITTLTSDKRNDNRWIKLHADQEYVLQVSLQRAHIGFHKVQYLVSSLKCFTPDTNMRYHTHIFYITNAFVSFMNPSFSTGLKPQVHLLKLCHFSPCAMFQPQNIHLT